MNTKMREYNAKKLLTYCIQKAAEQGTETARITNREMCRDLGMSSQSIMDAEEYIEAIGAAYFRKKAGSKLGTVVTFDSERLQKMMQQSHIGKTEAEIDDFVYDVITDIGKVGKPFVLLAGDIKDKDIGPVALGKSVERLAVAGLITSRPLVIDEKWLIKILEKAPEPTPKDEPIESGKCLKCGAALPDGAKFCCMCGERRPKTEIEQLKDQFMEVVSRVARMYNNSERANKDLAIMQKVAGIAFKEV